MKLTIEKILDFFYPLFSKIFDKTTFRYAACGGTNTVFDILLFFVSYNYVLHKQNFVLSSIVLTPHIGAFLLAFLISFPTGFLLMRYVVFQETAVKKTAQLLKYFLVVIGCILLNYVFLKLFVDYLGWFATPAKIVTTFFVVIFSYTSQKNFTFKSSNSGDIEPM
jgi:putative flippase GtrA